MSRARPLHRQRGAALLLAMLIMTLVTTLAASMVWQQYRAIQVEAAERARTQAAWILTGALDWARLILREDCRPACGADHLGEPWAVPLAEARLSSFLAADRNNNSVAENDSLDAFLSGSITDAQSRYNLRRLIGPDGKPVPAEVKVLENLCSSAGATGDCADRIAGALVKAWLPAGSAGTAAAAIAPQRLSQLAWLGIDADTLKRLEPWVDVLPTPAAPVNVNTAPAEVIAAVVEGMSVGNAQRLVQERQREPIRDLTAATIRVFFPATSPSPPPGLDIKTSFFIVRGRLRLEERVLEERSLIQRTNNEVTVRSRERVNLLEGG